MRLNIHALKLYPWVQNMKMEMKSENGIRDVTSVTSLIQTNTTFSYNKSSLAVENIVFNVIIMVLVILLAVFVWWLMRDQKRQYLNLRTRLTQSFSRFTMVSFVNNNDEVNIS
jgi:hypothetical protein